jgi:hypothetical protein
MMDKDILDAANSQAKALVGLRGLSFGRAAAMAWINFGAAKAGHALHLQCSFRVREGYDILVTSTDIFLPSAQSAKEPSFDIESFDWDVQGSNRYDEWVKRLDPAFLSSLAVTDAEVGACGDLTVSLERNIAIDVFVDATVDECWRLFNTAGGRHLVMTGTGPES